MKNPGWEVYFKNLHKSKIETWGKVKCKCHTMSKKERTFAIVPSSRCEKVVEEGNKLQN